MDWYRFGTDSIGEANSVVYDYNQDEQSNIVCGCLLCNYCVWWFFICVKTCYFMIMWQLYHSQVWFCKWHIITVVWLDCVATSLTWIYPSLLLFQIALFHGERYLMSFRVLRGNLFLICVQSLIIIFLDVLNI